MSGPSLLTPARRATLLAAARRILPPDATPAAVEESVAIVERQLAAMASHKSGELALALSLFGARAAALVSVGSARPFARLAAHRQDRMLERWGASRVPTQRTVFQGVRRLLLAAYYSRDAATRAVGYRGPMHDRAGDALFGWEGAVRTGGAAAAHDTDDEPVAREPAPSDAKGAPPQVEVAKISSAPRHPSPARRTESPPAAAATARPSRSTAETRSAFPGVTVGANVRDGTRLRADDVVVGSGAGGAVAAARLAEAGREVVILEEGGLYAGADFTERESDMTAALYAERGLRTTDDLSVALLQGRTVGGSTTVNWMIMLRTRDWVLDEWAERFGTVGMSPADMAPLFDLVERETHARPVPDDAHSANNRIVLDGARALGWRAEPAVINARGCVRSGFCGYGCRYDAKQGTLTTYVPRALAAGATLYADVRAERVEVVERATTRLPRKRVTASVLDRATGLPRGRLTVEAPVVVLAGGAVGTPVLLQRSGMGGGGVGKWLRLHPTTAVVGVYDHDVYGAGGIPLSAMCDEFIRRDANGYGFWIECPPLHPMLAAAAAPGFGAEHAAFMRDFPRLGSTIALTRDGADRELSNGSVRARRGGGTRLRYRLGPRDRAHFVESMRAAARLHLACGAREVRTLHTRPVRLTSERDLGEIDARSVAPNDIALFSAHVNGTCRMGRDPRTSGVSPDLGERHGVRGLFVCDGSILPTALGVNPQETIMALATLLAERIAGVR